MTEIALEIPNFPIMLNAILTGISDTPPAHMRVKRRLYTNKYTVM